MVSHTTFEVYSSLISVTSLGMTDSPDGRGQSHVTHLKNFSPILSLELVKLGTLNFVC